MSVYVKVWTSTEEWERGVIRYSQDNVTIELDSGQVISNRISENIYFEPTTMFMEFNTGNGVVEVYPKDITPKPVVQLKPKLVVQHPYTNTSGQFIEDIFPPSTSGFYGRLLNGKKDASYFVHRVKDSPRFWLAIVDPLTNRIFATHYIQPYEAEALALIDDQRIDRRQINESIASSTKTREEILSILDSPAPSWEDLSKILEGVSISNLQIGGTVRETYNRIVPTAFPEAIREELMAFLAYVVRSDIPDDPLTYWYGFSSIRLLQTLLLGHTMHLIDESDWPPYVKLMILAARGQLEAPKRAVSDSVLSEPWFVFSQKCAEYLPSWKDIAIQRAKTLNESDRIVLGLPTTKGVAKRTKKSWKKRFAEISPGLRVRGQVATSSLGLVELVYLGAAYRWPHRHMKFIARLGSTSENPPHLQVMLMPHNAAERIRRTLPSIINVAWSARTSNLDLFDDETHSWHVPVQRIVDSIDKRSSIRKLKNRFGKKGVSETYSMSKADAKVVDLVSEGVDLSYLEIPEYLMNLGLSKGMIRRRLKNLINRRIISLTYEVSDANLVSLAIVMQGNSENITSLITELLQNTPTSYARIDKTGESGVILSRLPEISIHEIAAKLTSHGSSQDLNIRCMRPTAFRGYTSNLYQRLLKDDGTWDDDVSAFLSQARSKRRELSKSNA